MSAHTVGEDYVFGNDETYSLSNAETVLVFLNITDDNIVEAMEFIGIVIESNVSAVPNHFVFIQDNDRKCMRLCIVV